MGIQIINNYLQGIDDLASEGQKCPFTDEVMDTLWELDLRAWRMELNEYLFAQSDGTMTEDEWVDHCEFALIAMEMTSNANHS